MVKLILTKKEAVEMYGSENCKEHFIKYGKLTNKEIEKSLIREMERYYNFVETVKPAKGRSLVYKLSGEKVEPTVKEDGRISNGAWKIPYTKNMDIMIVSVLEQGLVTETAQSLSKWAMDFTVITPTEYNLLQSRYNEHLKANHLQGLKDKKSLVSHKISSNFLFSYFSV